RRRHTRFSRDWSSDVCSSDLLYRMQIVVDLAAQFGRKVAFVGRGVVENSEIGQRLGYLRIPGGVQIRDSDVRSYPSQDVVCICKIGRASCRVRGEGQGVGGGR